MLLDVHAAIHPGEQYEAQAYELTSTLACGLACARTNIRGDAHTAIRPNAQADAQSLPKGSFCEKGLSALQINVLSLACRAARGLRPTVVLPDYLRRNSVCHNKRNPYAEP